MLKNGKGQCWNDIKRRWESCPPINTPQSQGSGRGTWQPNPYASCCFEAPCCLNCNSFNAFVSCLTSTVWNNPIWGWANINSGSPTIVDYSGAYRSFERSACFMHPELGSGGLLPLTLYLHSDMSEEACYFLAESNFTQETEVDINLPFGTEAITCWTFQSSTGGCPTFSVCWRYTTVDVGGGNFVRQLLETRACIDNVSSVYGSPGSFTTCEACTPNPPTPPACVVGVVNLDTGGVETVITINLGDVDSGMAVFDLTTFGLQFAHFQPPCCTDIVDNSSFIVNFDNTILTDVMVTFDSPPVVTGNNPFAVTFMNLANNIGAGVVTIRLITPNCNRWTLNLVYNFI